jgi:hypothetical protein
VAFCGIVVIMVVLDPKFVGSDLAKDNGFLTVIKIHSMTAFLGEVKPAVPCCKILWHVKDPYSMREILTGKIHRHMLLRVSCSATRCVCWLLPESCGGQIRNNYNSDGDAR